MKVPSATRLPSGSWRVRVMVDGKTHSITEPTKKDAVAKAMALKAGIIKEKYRPQSITLRTAYERYIQMKDGVLSPSTIAGYTRLSHNTFQELMDYRLEQLSNEKIQRAISSMARTKSSKYVANASGLLSSVLKAFYEEFNYNVTLPQKQKNVQRALSTSEINALIDASKDTVMELPILMALWMGMRLSEIRGARYEDIKNGRLHICNAIVDDIDGNGIEKPPKTFSGDRWVNIPPKIQELIGEGNGYIVALTGQAIYKRLQRLCEKAGIEPCRFHDLRHTNAAIMLSLGIDSRYAQERNGWKSEYMYKQVYGYTMTEGMDEASRLIDDYFGHTFDTNNCNTL